jgi:hypothetical protein
MKTLWIVEDMITMAQETQGTTNYYGPSTDQCTGYFGGEDKKHPPSSPHPGGQTPDWDNDL